MLIFRGYNVGEKNQHLRSMNSSATVFLAGSAQGNEKLHDIGLSIDEVREIALTVRSAWSEASPLGPRNAPGLLAFIAGVESIRSFLIAKGWQPEYPENIEATLRPDNRVRIIYQNVDEACRREHVPRPISRKGAGSRRLIDSSTLEMFPDELQTARAERTVTWILCISVDATRVKAELSRPTSFQGSVYKDFEERVFLVDEEFDDPDPLYAPEDDIDDGEIQVTRK